MSLLQLVIVFAIMLHAYSFISFTASSIRQCTRGRSITTSSSATHKYTRAALSSSSAHRMVHMNNLMQSQSKPKVLFILGGPGSGKGTQSEMIASMYGMKHLSAGELLRGEMDSGSDDGKLIDVFLKEGKILPVAITLKLLRKAITDSMAHHNRFVVDGFPRNLDNVDGWVAAGMDDYCDVEGVLYLDCPEDVLEERLLSRGANGSGRSDDNKATISKRFNVFRDVTLPVIDHFKRQNKLKHINGNQDIQRVFNDVKDVVEAYISNELIAITSSQLLYDTNNSNTQKDSTTVSLPMKPLVMNPSVTIHTDRSPITASITYMKEAAPGGVNSSHKETKEFHFIDGRWVISGMPVSPAMFYPDNAYSTSSKQSATSLQMCASDDTDVNVPNSKKAKQEKVKQVKKESEPIVQTKEEIKQARISKMDEMKAVGVNPFAYTYTATHKTDELQKLYSTLANGTEDASIEVSVSGRIMIRRIFGKLAFFTLQDSNGIIQLYIDKGRLDDEFNRIKDWTDNGDIIGVKGTVKRTDKGELSVYVSSWNMLTKALAPLPDKFHGLTDVNLRYRQRHMDMIVNPEVRNVFKARSFIISSIRKMLDTQGFYEIETPILNDQPGGAEAKPFETYHNTLDMPLTLRIATELHLKRLVVGGFDKVYEIGRIFRNEGISTRHNPEFTSIELYQAYSDYNDMMVLTETMISNIAKELTGSMIVPYQGEMIDLTPPWKRVTMSDIVQEKTGIDFMQHLATPTADITVALIESLKAQAIDKGVSKKELASKGTIGEILNVCFEELCESTLVQPTFITNHPIEISPLAKPHRSLAGVTERFEMFMVGREHANAFSELTDPIDQRQRFNAQAAKKAAGDEEACGVDEDFLCALESGMPPTAGLGIGIDRVVMVLTNSPAIRDVIAFPLLRKNE